MDPNSIVIAAVVGVVLWIMMRRRRQSGAREASASGPATKQAQKKPRTMPRIGTPGTITFNQIQALKEKNFTPDKNWSKEEAALILDAVVYLRAVCRIVADDDDGIPPLEVQNELLRIVLTTEDVRDYVRRWGEARREAGLDELADDEPDLPRNNQFQHVANAARRFLTQSAAPAVSDQRQR